MSKKLTSTMDERISLRVESDLKKTLELAAFEENRSLNNYLITLIKKGVNYHGKKKILRQSRSKPLNLRLQPDLYDELERKSFDNCHSVQTEIISILISHLEEKKSYPK